MILSLQRGGLASKQLVGIEVDRLVELLLAQLEGIL